MSELSSSDQKLHVCPDCKCQFVQPFVCTTCGAEKLYDATVRGQAATISALQARIDALMFEYCPGEMTMEQIERWVAQQRAES